MDDIRPKWVKPKRACAEYSMGLTKLYELINQGLLETKKIGASRLIGVASLDRLFTDPEPVRSPGGGRKTGKEHPEPPSRTAPARRGSRARKIITQHIAQRPGMILPGRDDQRHSAARAVNWWRCRCPVHNSKGSTLALRDTASGLAVFCHAGCPRDDVLDELRRLGLLGERNHPAVVSPREIGRSRGVEQRNREQRIAAAYEAYWRKVPSVKRLSRRD